MMMKNRLLLSTVLVSLLLLSSAHATSPIKGLLKKEDVPSGGWMSVNKNGAQVLPADFSSHGEEAAKMKHAWHRLLEGGDYSTLFLDGSETYYDDYAQAWRYLGFFIDCNEDEHQDSRDQEENGYQETPGCPRYLLWAAYVDPNYAGGGIGEYQFYNRHKGVWDSSSCTAADGRCAPMDCHLEDTDFQLLGFFKEPNYGDWFEQLFKHEGICVWTDDEYDFMQDERKVWPERCTNMGIQDGRGRDLYYDVKPLPTGTITLGIYTEETCTQDYTGWESQMSLLERYLESGNVQESSHDSRDEDRMYDNNVVTLERYIDLWNDAFDIFKICQPCRSYDLGWNQDLTNGQDRQGGYYGDDDDDEYPEENAYYDDAGNGDYFTCKDDAGYTNVNQCMKFRTKTDMEIAFIDDLRLAEEQGTILEVSVNGKVYGNNEEFKFEKSKGFEIGMEAMWLSLSVLFLIAAIALFYRAWSRRSQNASALKSPLMEESNGELA